ncbi:MAG: tetratricopeptide repeat protein, partial [Candidatus Hodarchaeota archaeon]
MNRLDEAREVINEGDAILKSLTEKERETGAYWIAYFEQRRGDYYVFKKDLDTALEHFHRALALREKIGDLYTIAHSLGKLGEIYSGIYSGKGEYDTALDYFQRALGLAKQIGNSDLIAFIFNNIGIIYLSKNEPDTALTYCQQALNIYEEISNPNLIARFLYITVYSYILKGEMNTALEYNRRYLSLSREIYQKKENPVHLTRCFTFFAWIHYFKGELDTALDYVQQALVFQGKVGLEETIAIFSSALVYQAQGELDAALERFQQCLSDFEQSGDVLWMSTALFYLILVVLAQENHLQAQDYLNRLQKLQIHSQDPGIHLRSRLAEALVLKQSPRLKEKIRAQNILEQLVEEKVTWFESTALAMVHLSELLIAEVKLYGEPDVWKEAKALIKKLYGMAQDQFSFSMSVEALLLLAKAAVVDGELPQALNYYEQARFTATEKSLTGLLAKVDMEQKRFEADFEKMQTLIQNNASLQERLKSARMEDYIKAIQPLLKMDPPPKS